jgi:hypothetical protein
MLPIVEQGAAHPPQNKLRAAGRRECNIFYLARRFTTDVQYGDIGPIPDLITRFLDAAAKIDFFSVQKELRIE